LGGWGSPLTKLGGFRASPFLCGKKKNLFSQQGNWVSLKFWFHPRTYFHLGTLTPTFTLTLRTKNLNGQTWGKRWNLDFLGRFFNGTRLSLFKFGLKRAFFWEGYLTRKFLIGLGLDLGLCEINYLEIGGKGFPLRLGLLGRKVIKG